MSELPSFFNKEDFLGALLPGYIGVIFGLIILFPGVLTLNKNPSGLPLDFFSAVVFLVAGPAVGYTLRQIFTIAINFKDNRKWENKRKHVINDIRLRHTLSDVEREMLDETEAKFFFHTSTGMAVFLLRGSSRAPSKLSGANKGT